MRNDDERENCKGAFQSPGTACGIAGEGEDVYKRQYRDGICQVTSGFYTKMVEFYDINYDLLEIEDKGEILEEYSLSLIHILHNSGCW